MSTFIFNYYVYLIYKYEQNYEDIIETSLCDDTDKLNCLPRATSRD